MALQYDLTIADDVTVKEFLIDMPQEGWQIHTYQVLPPSSKELYATMNRHYILWEREVE